MHSREVVPDTALVFSERLALLWARLVCTALLATMGDDDVQVGDCSTHAPSRSLAGSLACWLALMLERRRACRAVHCRRCEPGHHLVTHCNA